MRKIYTRIAVMFTLCITLTALAACGDTASTPAPSANNNMSQPTHNISASTPTPLAVMDTYDFGGYEWLVLDVQDDMVLIITKDIIDLALYVELDSTYSDLDPRTWENSDVRLWLNDEFLNIFNSEEITRIQMTHLINNGNPYLGTPGGNDTYDQVFLLSLDEVLEYFGDSGAVEEFGAKYISDEFDDNRTAIVNMTKAQLDRVALRFSERYSDVFGSYEDLLDEISELNYEPYGWSLRTPGGFDCIAYFPCIWPVTVYGDGSITLWGTDATGIRPAMWISYP